MDIQGTGGVHRACIGHLGAGQRHGVSLDLAGIVCRIGSVDLQRGSNHTPGRCIGKRSGIQYRTIEPIQNTVIVQNRGGANTQKSCSGRVKIFRHARSKQTIVEY